MRLSPNTEVGRYRIVDRLGGGGMGEVYRAHDPALGRDVALKVISEADVADPAMLRRFTREAQAASALNHPNIVSVFDVGTCEGGPFIVMELIEGETLRTLLRRNVSLDVLLPVVRQVARALAVAHGAAIVHRDVKPENVMVRPDGYVKVLDFGLARSSQPTLDGSAVTMSAPQVEHITEVQSGAFILGTVAYLSPEQARSETVSGASDVFALGVTLYEVAARRHPFAADGYFATVARIVSDEAIAPSRFNPEVPAALDALILRMLEKDPRSRPGAAEIERVLGEIVGGTSIAVTAPVPRTTVGHEGARDQLRHAFAAAAAGRGALLSLAGEPGMGKTTLVEDFLRELAASGASCTLARGRCSERLAGAGAYLPWLEALDSMRDERGSSGARLLKTVAPTWHAQVAPLSTGEESLDARAAIVNRAGSQEWMKRELGAFLEEVSRSRPLVLFLDDVHWADPSTVDLIAYVAERLASMRVLMIVTFRPSDLRLARHPFLPLLLDLQGRGIAREIQIDALGADDVGRYLQLEFPEHQFPAEFTSFVHQRTEGHPLFMADLLRSLRDRGIIGQEGGAWRLLRPTAEIEAETPASVRSLIELKIARLTEEDRRLLVVASVQGHEFEGAIVARAAKVDAPDVEEGLERLERTHALVRALKEVELPDGTLTAKYVFAHVLYQNTLYGSLGPARRAALSRAVAHALLDSHGDQAATRASELALLFEAAREFPQAARFFLAASERARQVFAFREALALAERGLEALERLPDTPERAARELAHLMAIAVATHPLRGYAAPELDAVHGRLQVLCDQLGDTPEIWGALCALGAYRFMRAELRAGLDQIDRMFRVAEQTGHPAMQIWTEWGYGASLSHTGDLRAAHEHLERGQSLYTPALHPAFMVTTGFDAGIGCFFQDARVLWLLGDSKRSLRMLDEALARARATAHPLMIAFAMFFVAWVHQLRRDAAAVLTVTADAMPIAEQHGFPHIQVWLNGVRGWAIASTGDPAAGEQILRQAIGFGDAIGLTLMRTNFMALLAEAVSLQGRRDEALAILEEADALAERNGERFYLAEIWRLKGELSGDRTAVERAVAIAREQHAKSFELRAAAALDAMAR